MYYIVQLLQERAENGKGETGNEACGSATRGSFTTTNIRDGEITARYNAYIRASLLLTAPLQEEHQARGIWNESDHQETSHEGGDEMGLVVGIVDMTDHQETSREREDERGLVVGIVGTDGHFDRGPVCAYPCSSKLPHGSQDLES